jgi:hypothetical protein
MTDIPMAFDPRDGADVGDDAAPSTQPAPGSPPEIPLDRKTAGDVAHLARIVLGDRLFEEQAAIQTAGIRLCAAPCTERYASRFLSLLSAFVEPEAAKPYAKPRLRWYAGRIADIQRAIARWKDGT